VKKKFVLYLRVSTSKQGLHGLGMDAQRQAAVAFLTGADGELLGEYAEVESGKETDRPQLQQAIALCRKTKARLLIAKLDRLARNASFLLGLRDSGIDFVAADMPHADRFTVGIMALVAEKERELISERTKAGLAQARRRGTRLGNPRLAQARKKAASSTRKRANDYAAQMAPVLHEIQHTGRVTGLREIAECLNARGYVSPNGKRFTRRTVKRLLHRIARGIRQ
jgi:DNA invertase Pin-like site-specific DNA recombinase